MNCGGWPFHHTMMRPNKASSVASRKTAPAINATVSFPPLSLVSLTTTAIPSWANRRATARPVPFPPEPVMIATLPSRFILERPRLLAAVGEFAGDGGGHGSAFEAAAIERRIARLAG